MDLMPIPALFTFISLIGFLFHGSRFLIGLFWRSIPEYRVKNLIAFLGSSYLFYYFMELMCVLKG